jgi:hypothetical protein
MNGLKRMVTMRGGIQKIGAQSSATKKIASSVPAPFYYKSIVTAVYVLTY